MTNLVTLYANLCDECYEVIRISNLESNARPLDKALSKAFDAWVAYAQASARSTNLGMSANAMSAYKTWGKIDSSDPDARQELLGVARVLIEYTMHQDPGRATGDNLHKIGQFVVHSRQLAKE